MKAVRLIGVIALTLAGFVFGFSYRDIRVGAAPSVDAFRALVGQERDEPSATETFRDHYNTIASTHHSAPNPDTLTYAAMEGLFASLGDPHTVFMNPDLTESFTIDTRGDFVGIGARLSPHALGARVETVFEGAPASRAGLKRFDVITAVDGVDVGGMTVTDIVKLIKGESGTTVELELMREGEDSRIGTVASRELVVIPSVEARMVEGYPIGYVGVTNFSEITASQFDTALQDFERREVQGLVIDLRGNPGGLLETAVEMLSRYVDGKTVVTMRARGGAEEVVRSRRGRTSEMPFPTVVLVDEASASASEIFAGVLRDYRQATLVGEHTYGKASVQNVLPLRDGSSAKITVARYYLPGGEDISRRVDEEGIYQSGGILPDVEVEPDMSADFVPGDVETDNQLRRAIEVIQEKLGEPTASLAPREPGVDGFSFGRVITAIA